ncbi:MAG: nicotinate (nicotinamide) nucleotide adenylyltransferase [bacterium]|nr:nicotinate (nicotinamide) nucleotide adenylyltransferase [bacterium]
MRNKVGLLGGTFNPIHLGHVDLGLHIRENYNLDKIMYILSAQPPHKKNQNVAPASIRWQMLNKALKPYPCLEPCDIEMKRSTWSWTVDTITQLRKEYQSTDFYFISGSEGFLKIKTWKNYKELLRTLSFIVVLRKPRHLQEIKNMLKDEGITPVSDFNTPPTSVYIFSYESDKLFISSTLIRERVKSSLSVDDLVKAEVKTIMEEFNLYES